MAWPSSLTPDFDLMVSAARTDGWTRASALGYAPSADTAGVPLSAWGGTTLYPWLTAATALEAIAGATDVGDTGTGAWTLTVAGLDTLFAVKTVTVQLNGTTPVSLGSGWYRINSARITRAGSTRKNGANVIIRDAGAGPTRGIILAGKGTMRQAAFTTPAGFIVEIPWLLLIVDNVTGVDTRRVSFETYFAGPTPAAAIYPLPINNTNVQPYNHQVSPPIVLQEKTDFDLPINSVSNNATIITAGWNGFMKRMSA